MSSSIYGRLSTGRPFVIAAVSITACVTAWCAFSAIRDLKQLPASRQAAQQHPTLNGATENAEAAVSEAPRESQNLLNILYLIAEDQAKRDGYIHRGVSCNACGMTPIRGVRFRCSNCVDFDLCEHCEAMDNHHRTHLFYKIRIPIPTMGNPRHAQRPWYPGTPCDFPPLLTFDQVKKLQAVCGCESLWNAAANIKVEQAEIEGIYEQFKCLASTSYPDDPWEIHGAIDRHSYNTSLSPVAGRPNLICDRIFDFYDTNHDGLIGFEEFITALSILQRPRAERLKYAFEGYDMDGDGYITRDDAVRMLGAYYALSRDLVSDLVKTMEDEMQGPQTTRSVINGSQPVSTAFSAAIPRAIHAPRKDGSVLQVLDDGSVDYNEELLLPREFLHRVERRSSFGSVSSREMDRSEGSGEGSARQGSAFVDGAPQRNDQRCNGELSHTDVGSHPKGRPVDNSGGEQSMETDVLRTEFLEHAKPSEPWQRPTNSSHLPEAIASVDTEDIRAKMLLASMISEGIMELVSKIFGDKERLSLSDLMEKGDRNIALLGAWLDIASI